jgi:hypothetical protein
MRPILLLALLLTPSMAFALSMTTAEQPHSVRQNYAQGKWSEVDLRCVEDKGCDPVFRIGQRRRALEYPFTFERTIDMRGGYTYFAGPGDGFIVTLPVECLDEDLAMVDAGIRDDVACRVKLFDEGNVLKTGEITVSGARSESRELEPLLPAGVEGYPASMVLTGWLQAEPKAMDCTHPDSTWPVSAVFDIEGSDAGPAWNERLIAVRVPCAWQTVPAQGGGERVPYESDDRYRVTVSRVAFQLIPELDEFSPRHSAWLVTDVMRLPDE